MSDTSLLFNFLKGRDTATPHMRKVADSSNAMASRIKLSSVVSVAATATVVAGFAALGAQGVALISSLGPVIGLIGLMPALLFGAAASVGVLLMAFSGLGAALKQTAGGAGGSSAAIVAAERRIEHAQRAAAQAQLDLNAARKTAADQLADVTRALNRAHLDERGAVLAVADAQRNLREARASGDRSQVAHAQLGYEEAVQSLEEIRARLADVTAEEAKRRTAGVEGSDEVKTALQRQADAARDLADAQASMKQGAGGVDKAAEAYRKLTLEGRQLVDVLRAMGPAWRTVKQAVQSSVFANVAGDLKALSSAYLPVMRTQLVAIGSGWNNAFRGSLTVMATAGYVKDMNDSLSNMAAFWQRVGAAFAPFLSGFRHWIQVGSTFLPGMGSWILNLANRFEKWSAAARSTGKAHDWIANSITVLSQFWQIIKNVTMSFVAIFRAGSGGPDWLPGLIAGTATLRAFLESPGGQEKLAAVFTTLRDIGSQLWAVLTNIGPVLLNMFSAGGLVSDTMSVFGVVIGFVADHLGFFQEHLGLILGLFLAYKTVQMTATAAGLADLPIRAAMAISMWRHTAALRANTLAMNTQMGVEKKGLFATIASKAAMVAKAAILGVVTAAQWLYNVALSANPIALIIIAVIALVAAFVYLWTHSEGFRKFFIGLWEHIWGFLKMIGAWFAGPFVDFFVGAWNFLKGLVVGYFHFFIDTWKNIIKFVLSLPGKVSSAAKGIWDGLVTSFKAAINWLIRLWNDFHLTIGGGTVLGIDIPSVTLNTPNIPYLESGGTITRGGAAVVADRNGRGGEVVSLPRGAQVTPLSSSSSVGGGGDNTLHLTGDDSRMIELFFYLLRKGVRARGGNVQIAVMGK